RRPSSASRSRPSSASSSRSVASNVSSAPSHASPSPNIISLSPSTDPVVPSQHRPSSSHSRQSVQEPVHSSQVHIDPSRSPPRQLHSRQISPQSRQSPQLNKKSPPHQTSPSKTPVEKSLPGGQDFPDSVSVESRSSEMRPGSRSRKSSRSDTDLDSNSDIRSSKDSIPSLRNSGDCSDAQSTLKDEDDSQQSVVCPKKDVKKKKFLRNHIKNRGDSLDDDKSEVDSICSSKSSKTIFDNPKPVARHRPLPKPPIKIEEDGNIPKQREDNRSKAKSSDSSSRSSSISSSKEDGDVEPTPRSLPNLSARERRRQKNPASMSAENPNSARIRLRKLPERHGSERITRSEKADSTEPVRAIHPIMKKPIRQPSINDDTSSSSEELQPKQDSKEQAKRRYQTYVIDTESQDVCACHPANSGTRPHIMVATHEVTLQQSRTPSMHVQATKYS
ncbi:hypothetical protein LOTGIDRAFT_165298, partial [Lottia gigantea]